MKLSSRTLFGIVLGAWALTACDYQRFSPGNNTQFEHGFVNAPGWRNEDVNRDSINYKQTVRKPIGEGSATAIRNGSVQDQLNSAPAGKSAASPQAANGTMQAVGKSMNGKVNTTNAAGTAGQNTSTTTNMGPGKGE